MAEIAKAINRNHKSSSTSFPYLVLLQPAHFLLATGALLRQSKPLSQWCGITTFILNDSQNIQAEYCHWSIEPFSVVVLWEKQTDFYRGKKNLRLLHRYEN